MFNVTNDNGVEFDGNFWGEKNAGYTTLMQTSKDGFTAVRDLADLVREMSSSHDVLARSLAKLGRPPPQSLYTQGSFTPLLIQMKAFVEKLSSLNIELVKKWQDLHKRILQYGETHKEEQKKLKDSETTTGETVNSLITLSSSLQKSKEAFHARTLDFEKQRRIAGTTEKELEKSEAKARRAREDYSSQVEKYNSTRLQFIERLGESARRIQASEDTHLKTVSAFVFNFLDILAGAHISFTAAEGEFRTQLLADFTVDKLLAYFVQRKKTGQDPPGEVIFEEADLTALPELSESQSSSQNQSGGRFSLFRPKGRKKEKENKEKPENHADFDSINSSDNEMAPKTPPLITTTPPDLTPPLNRDLNSLSSQNKRLSSDDEFTERPRAASESSFESDSEDEKIKVKFQIHEPLKAKTYGTAAEIASVMKGIKPLPPKKSSVPTSLSMFALSTDTTKLPWEVDWGPQDQRTSPVPPVNSSADLSAMTHSATTINFHRASLTQLPAPAVFTPTESRYSKSSTNSPSNFTLEQHESFTDLPLEPPMEPPPPLPPTVSPPILGINHPEHFDNDSLASSLPTRMPNSQSHSVLSGPGRAPPVIPARQTGRRSVPAQLQQRQSPLWQMTEPVAASRSRGSSPLTVPSGSPGVVDLALGYTETVNAVLRDNSAPFQKVAGTVVVSFPAALAALLEQRILPLSIMVERVSTLAQLHHNKQLMRQTTADSLQYSFDLEALKQHLARQSNLNSAAAYFNIDILKYQLSATGDPPLEMTVDWHCDTRETKLAVSIRAKSRDLTNVSLTALVDGGATSVSGQQARWNSEENRVTFTVGTLLVNEERQLTAVFPLSTGPGSPAPVSASWSSEGSSLSGLQLQLLSPHYNVNILRRKIVSGKYQCEMDSTLHLV